MLTDLMKEAAARKSATGADTTEGAGVGSPASGVDGSTRLPFEPAEDEDMPTKQ